ncbi:multi-sensor hybrid histidine kinase [Crinalium epipsammum PCC 9333]|uniref:Circadian input-output histidine kinase CikA n=1 Tax=Crinalium epipsammum PCC 9333 TaxID=1173022 RepID=K9VUB3_9CYAN|nr:PAS domain S-box protein [Crinalium epipsammum]AFZ11698.1 multi-sensor hybrid histidine kinase [Crinalium epipsammum PCC 9333]
MSNQSDYRLWVKAFSKPSLRTILVVPFVLQILAVVGIAGYLSYKNGQEAVEDLANQVMEEVSERISDRLDTYLQTPQNIVAANHFAVKQGTVKITDFEQLRQQFWQQISLNPSLGSSAFWSEDGQMIGYRRVVSQEDREAVPQLIGKNLTIGTTYLLEVSKANLGQQGFYYVDSQGKPKKLLYQFTDNFRQLPWYRQVKPTKKQSWSQIFISRAADVLVIQSFAPVYNAKSEFKGVFTSTYLLSEISNFLHKLQFSPSGQTFIIERSGNLVATSTREIPHIKDAQGQITRLAASNSRDNRTREIVQQLTQKFGNFGDLKTNQQLRLVSNKQTQFVQVVPYQDKYGVDCLIVVVLPESDFIAQIHANTRNTILLCLGAVGFAIAFGTFTATKITRPLQQLSQASQALAAGELDSQIPSNIPIKELDVISVSFNQMAQELQASFNQVRNALEESKERYTTIFRNSPDPITITDLVNGRLIEVNEAFLNLTGYSRAEVIGRTAVELNLIVNPEEAAEIVQQLQATNRINSYEFNWRVKSGEVKTSLVSSELIELDGQHFVLTISKEIGELKRVENQLQQALQELRNHADNSPLAIIEWDREFRVRRWSKRAEKIFGWNEREVLGKHLNEWEFVYQLDRKEVDQVKERLFSKIERQNILCNRNYTKDGRIIDCEWYNSVLVDKSGEIISILSLAHDITERKQAEVELRESKRLIEQVTESSSAILYIVDLIELRNVYVNSQMERLFGYSVQEIQAMGMNMLPTLVHPEDLPRVRENHLRCFSLLDDEWTEIEYRMRDKQGNWRCLYSRDCVFSRTADGQPKQLLGTAIDITERKQAELEIQRAKEAAVAANHAKSTFLSNMSHELRTPLNIILGFTQLMVKSDNLSPEHLENINIINRSGEHLLNLINDVLDMAKIESGSVTLNERNFNLYQLLDELETMFRLKTNDKGLELIVDRSANVPECVCTDDIKLRQVLINLVNNALKFTQQGSISIQVGLADDRDRNSNKSRFNFAITDTGAGIPGDELEKIFQPFQQTITGKTAKEGTGLGLTISQKFINMMGGKITVSSEVGRGSIFKFDIQVSIPEQAPTKPTHKSTQKVIGVAPNQPQYRILIADDTTVNRLLLSMVISQLGLDIKEAGDGMEVLEIWSQWQPHLIFMDIQMPVMDGVEATQKIRIKEQETWQLEQINNRQVSPHKTVIVALTASIFEEERIAIMSAGCDDFISKPFQLENIIDCLSDHLQLAYIYEQP